VLKHKELAHLNLNLAGSDWCAAFAVKGKAAVFTEKTQAVTGEFGQQHPKGAEQGRRGHPRHFTVADRTGRTEQERNACAQAAWSRHGLLMELWTQQCGRTPGGCTTPELIFVNQVGNCSPIRFVIIKKQQRVSRDE
jgi:hypothetical protein